MRDLVDDRRDRTFATASRERHRLISYVGHFTLLSSSRNCSAGLAPGGYHGGGRSTADDGRFAIAAAI
jgi:hypothetical protein